jgi:hydrogenase nickel incorporation protein HypA/HybF
MHEYSLVAELVRQVEVEVLRAGAGSVTRLTVAVGDLSGVERDLFATAYEVFRERTVCAGAELSVRPVPALWSCPRCARAIPPGSPLRCSDCAMPARLAQGDEIVLERIEMEVG